MKRFINIHEHSSCHNYRKSSSNWVEVLRFHKGYEWGYTVKHTEVVFVLEGEFFISYDSFLGSALCQGQMLLLHSGVQFKATTTEGVYLFIIHLHDMAHLCDRIPFSALIREDKTLDKRLPSLTIKPVISTYLHLFLEAFSTGLHCSQFLELKVKEFLFLLRGYYSKKELSFFFRPVMNRDIPFAAFVLDNYKSVKTVTEFATLYSCSLSSFDKRFRIAFGTSAYQWMLKRKVDLLYHEINTTTKTFRQIGEEQGFLSLSQFTDFCKKHLGEAPSRIRQKKNIT